MQSKGAEPSNLAFIVVILYVLGYLNPDTREAFFWAGIIVGGLVLLGGLLWILDSASRKRESSSGINARSEAAEATNTSEAEELEEVLK